MADTDFKNIVWKGFLGIWATLLELNSYLFSPIYVNKISHAYTYKNNR